VSLTVVIQNAKRMHRIVLSVISLALPCSSTLSHKRHDIRETFTEHKMCVLISSINLSKNFSFQEEFRRHYHIITLSQMYIRRYVECPLFLSDFNEILILSTDFRKLLKHQIS